SWVPEALDRPSAAKLSEQQGKPPAPHARAKSHRNQGQTSSRLSQPELPHSKFLFLRTLPLVAMETHLRELTPENAKQAPLRLRADGVALSQREPRTRARSLCCTRLPGCSRGRQARQNSCPWASVHLCGHPTEKMDLDQLDLNPRIIAAVKKAKLRSVKEVLHLSGPDLQRLTRLSGPDVQRLLRAASSHLRGSSVCTGARCPGVWLEERGTGAPLLRQKEQFPEQHQRLSLGCPVLDGLLRGGLPLDGITELAGRSSAGKTQLALQLCLAVQLPRRHGGLGAGECGHFGGRAGVLTCHLAGTCHRGQRLPLGAVFHVPVSVFTTALRFLPQEWEGGHGPLGGRESAEPRGLAKA
ncbi:hypothetical protein E2I00_006066, partial [Balaenoptera physalus]